jgi:8-oxo-dGTP pyrophosphatase MutT (NUDIX family)
LRSRFSLAQPARLDSPEPRGAATPAAVLVPLVLREAGLTVLLTRRSPHLQDHPGQISFPGGRLEPHDGSLLETALREAHEEVGLLASSLEVLGELPDHFTGTGFCVRPVVAMVSPPFSLVLDAREVDEAFEVPLQFLMDPRNHEAHSRQVGEVVRHYVAMPYGDYFIWGATAAMLLSLRERLIGV